MDDLESSYLTINNNVILSNNSFVFLHSDLEFTLRLFVTQTQYLEYSHMFFTTKFISANISNLLNAIQITPPLTATSFMSVPNLSYSSKRVFSLDS